MPRKGQANPRLAGRNRARQRMERLLCQNSQNARRFLSPPTYPLPHSGQGKARLRLSIFAKDGIIAAHRRHPFRSPPCSNCAWFMYNVSRFVFAFRQCALRAISRGTHPPHRLAHFRGDPVREHNHFHLNKVLRHACIRAPLVAWRRPGLRADP